MLTNKNRFEGRYLLEGVFIGTRVLYQIIIYPKIKDTIHALCKNILTSLKLWDTQSCTMHLCLLQHLPRQLVLQQYTSLSLQICQCPVMFCCIDNLDGFCVKILFLCLFFLQVHCTVDICHFLPWLLTIFQCSFQEKKKIYIYIYNLHNGECASVFNALFKTRRISAFAFLRGLNMQLLQSPNSIYN